INTALATAGARYTRRLVADTAKRAVLVEDPARLAGLGADDVQAAARAAEEAGHPGKHLLTLSLFVSQPQLAQLEDADLRRDLFEASIGRGTEGE
ncbi:M3 family peptidase, partial [Mycobacterium tuberculosis]|nr:M3 family peptidase [Mycobacterium tuberculosis]